MKHIDIIEGRGRIAAGDKTIGEVRYQISVWHIEDWRPKEREGAY